VASTTTLKSSTDSAIYGLTYFLNVLIGPGFAAKYSFLRESSIISTKARVSHLRVIYYITDDDSALLFLTCSRFRVVHEMTMEFTDSANTGRDKSLLPVLTIAGTDSSGGAGIQVQFQFFSPLGRPCTDNTLDWQIFCDRQI
jgi:hypothetical protein